MNKSQTKCVFNQFMYIQLVCIILRSRFLRSSSLCLPVIEFSAQRRKEI